MIMPKQITNELQNQNAVKVDAQKLEPGRFSIDTTRKTIFSDSLAQSLQDLGLNASKKNISDTLKDSLKNTNSLLNEAQTKAFVDFVSKPST